MKTGINSKKKQ